MAKKSARPKHVQVPRSLLLTGKILERISPKLAALYAARLFTSPFKYKIPQRELEYDRKSKQKRVLIKAIDKEIVIYNYGDGERKILLVHGWSGRGTQLVKFADAVAKRGFSAISFDAPAHGKSSGKTTIMPEFIASIQQLEKEFGPFYAAIGHSLGGMSLLNSLKRGLKLSRMVTIGSGDVIQDIINEFTDKMQLSNETGLLMKKHFEKRASETMDSYSSYLAAETISIPVLVIHDENDAEVPVSCAHHIYKHLQNGQLMITKGLGHRKILGNHQVIEKSLEFIES